MSARAVVALLEPGVTGCLVEGAEGEVVEHALPDTELPEAVVRAVLRRSIAWLDAAVSRRRAVGLVATGPVVQGVVGGISVARVALEPPGALWLLLEGGLPPLEQVERAAGALCLPAAPSPLRACLDGSSDALLPASLRECRRWWVVATPCGTAPDPAARLVVQCCSLGDVTYAVVGGGASSRTAEVRELLRGRRAGVSRPRAVPSLGGARREADLALEVAEQGEVVCAEQQRSALVVRHVAKALDTLPDLGEDPLARLVAYDARRDGRLVETLRCWLTSRTDSLGVHGNTLRYRLRRIEEITGVDLRGDASGRLELQLRLAAQPQLSRRTSSTAS